MHAVVVSVTVNDGQAATSYLRERVVPAVSQAPGFVAGYWVRLEGGSGGRATVVFESEDAARAAAGQFQPAPGGAATIDSIDVGEVVAHA
jgi:hypothetical protein